MTADREQVRRDAEQRYEVHALFGPCTYEEAEAFFEANSEDMTLGAVWSCGLYDERDYKAELEQAERERDEAREKLDFGMDSEQVANLVLRHRESEARLAKVPALVEAALQVLDTTTSDEVHKEARRSLVEALTVYEQSRGGIDE